VNLFALAATQNKGGQAMSQVFSGILGAIAVSLNFGAAQFASGSDLHGQQVSAPAAEATVNREAKADRADAPAMSLKTQTISVKVDGLSDTSILVRVPLAQASRKEARNAPPAPTVSKAPVARTVACEPVVSVLTEVAKQLQPGRCIT
jgi:hypothetical protein